MNDCHVVRCPGGDTLILGVNLANLRAVAKYVTDGAVVAVASIGHSLRVTARKDMSFIKDRTARLRELVDPVQLHRPLHLA